LRETQTTVRNSAKPLFLIFALLLAGICSVPAFAAGDQVHFGSAIEVPKDTSVKDAVCFFCSVNVQGTVNGDVVVFFGSVNVDGVARHDVVSFFGDIRANQDSSIKRSLVNFFGSVWVGENASIGQDAVVMFGTMHSSQTASFGGNEVIQPGWVFWGPLLLITLGIVFAVREFRGYRYRLNSRVLRGL
jgi:hypothetical protein